jgi:energy-coupling factor transporter ATP-binding protein EcfA2
MSLIRMENVNFTYSDELTPVLKHINLTVEAGQIILLIGPTGSGKSTLLQIMAGITPHVTGGIIEGGVYFENIDVLRNPSGCRGKIGLIFQDPELQLVNLTVEDEVAFGPENLLLPTSVVRERVDWAIGKCRLLAQRHSFVYALSGGQKQRIAIAAGLAMHPDLLLMDGPLTNLDPVGSSEVLETINELIHTEATKTVMIASNKIDALLPLVTRIIVLAGGEILMDGSPEVILFDNRQLLSEIGVFLPEISRLWPVLHAHQVAAPLPRTPIEAAAQLRQLNPYILPAPMMIDPQATGENIVTAEEVSFAFGENVILEDISFNIERGEFLAVVGQNGSGKSTLMSLISGLRMPRQGCIRILGQDTQLVPPQGHVGYVFQYPEHQFVARTVDEELRYGLSQQFPPDEIEARVRRVMDLFGIQQRGAESPYTLSVGEKRMLSVATVLVIQPELIILDEPTTGLDHRLTASLMKILRDYVAESGMTVIQVSHDMEQIAEYCSRVLVIDQRRIIFNGTPQALFQSPEVLARAKLAAPPVCQVAIELFPETAEIPITVESFLAEVCYAGH